MLKKKKNEVDMHWGQKFLYLQVYDWDVRIICVN